MTSEMEPRLPLLALLRRAAGENDGSMALEAAFVLPTFFLLLFGIFEFSMLLTGYCSATYAVRAGARYASVHSSTSMAPASNTSVQSFVQANLFTPGSSSSVVPAVTYTPNSNVVGSVVNVTATWSQAISLPGYHSTIALSTQANRVITR